MRRRSSAGSAALDRDSGRSRRLFDLWVRRRAGSFVRGVYGSGAGDSPVQPDRIVIAADNGLLSGSRCDHCSTTSTCRVGSNPTRRALSEATPNKPLRPEGWAPSATSKTKASGDQAMDPK